jgi:O-6-methylguanine DNA methyltransferase
MTKERIPDHDERVEAGLRSLRTSAPATLAPGALIAAGLADAYAPVETPLGPALVTWNARGVSSVAWPADPAQLEQTFKTRHGRPLFQASAPPAAIAKGLERRLAGDRRASVPLDLRGSSPFEQAVWQKTLEIPRGEVRPYGWVAAEIGRPAAVRAVGTALGRNPVPLVVPCHRVVRTDGAIGQYSMGGPANKRRILDHEGVAVDEMERLARAGVRYVGSATTRVVCLPTCHHARRITDQHRVPFRTLAAATSAGFRPCHACRPTAMVA